MKNEKTRKLTLIGMLGAISIVLGMTPLGFIPLGPVNYTIMHIPVIIGAIVGGPVVGASVGLIFGCSSLLKAITTPTIMSPFFLNPLVSILPRIAIGLITYYIYKLFNKLGKKYSLVIATCTVFSAIVYLIYRLVNDSKAYMIDGNGIYGIIMNCVILVILFATSFYSYKKFRKDAIDVVLSAAIGSLSNTVLVLGMLYILYAQAFVEKLGMTGEVASSVFLTIAVSNGIPEMILSMALVTSIVLALKKNKQN